MEWIKSPSKGREITLLFDGKDLGEHILHRVSGALRGLDQGLELFLNFGSATNLEHLEDENELIFYFVAAGHSQIRFEKELALENFQTFAVILKSYQYRRVCEFLAGNNLL